MSLQLQNIYTFSSIVNNVLYCVNMVTNPSRRILPILFLVIIN